MNRRLLRRRSSHKSDAEVKRDVDEGFQPFVAIDPATGAERIGDYGDTLLGVVPNFDYASYLLNQAANAGHHAFALDGETEPEALEVITDASSGFKKEDDDVEVITDGNDVLPQRLLRTSEAAEDASTVHLNE